MKHILTAMLAMSLSLYSYAQSDIVITEIMYNGPESGTDSTEFIELYNKSANPIDMTGWSFAQGVDFTFPSFSLGAGEFAIVAVDSQVVKNLFVIPSAVSIFKWTTGALSNGGEVIVLIDSAGLGVDTVNFDDASPWPIDPDGNGSTLVLCDVNSDNNNGSNWQASNASFGPGTIINSLPLYGTPGTLNGCLLGSPFTLQLLHASDLEGGVNAINRAANFAAIIDTLEGTYSNTLIISSGDNYIPGPFFNAAGDAAMQPTLQYVYENALGVPSAANSIRSGNGRVDISIMNVIGFDASAVGNHEWDAGAGVFGDLVRPDIRNAGTQARWIGAQFPYLSANLDFTNEPATSGVFTSSILPNTDFQTDVNNLVAGPSLPRLAPATTILRNGELIGVVGATTQLLETISSPGGVSVVGGSNVDMNQLAGVLQPVINNLINNQGVNKVIVTTHLQQFSLEQQLIGLLNGVDIVMAGGSDYLLADSQDVLNAGDVAQGPYPFFTTNADGDTAVIVSTDGEYSYVGRLVIDFDASGKIVPSSIDPNVSGVFNSSITTVNNLWGSNDAFAVGTKGHYVDTLTQAVASIVQSKDGNITGKSAVYLEGRREFVRTEETNLGNLTADANLALAKVFDNSVAVSIKNGGGIRAEIGEVRETSPGVYQFLPPQENTLSGKDSLEVSQLDIENSMRFNNRLSVLDLTAADLKTILEHGVSASGPGQTQGRFPQVGGVSFSWDYNLSAGSRVVDIFIQDSNGVNLDTVALGGSVIGNASRVIKVVTLNFLAGGGDGYPFNTLGQNRVDLDTVASIQSNPGLATFAVPGSEQDAFAEYMLANYAITPFNIAETPADQDMRNINLALRAPATGPCSDLFISEYLEGASNNKALEIYNPTNTMIDLSDYYFLRDNNGSTTSTDTFQLDGMLAPADVYVVANSNAAQYILDVADTTSTTTFYNGDDCIRLVNSITGTVLDQIGVLGTDPGSSWTVTGTNGVVGATGEFDLVRDPSVSEGDTMWNTVVSTQWYVLDRDNFNSLGYHNAEGCGSSVPAYFAEELKALDANLAPDSLGAIAKITGVVHNPDQGFNSSEFALQDGTAGIWVTGADPIPGYSGATEGDVISVYGTVAFNNGVIRLAADSINFVKNNRLFIAEGTDTLNEYTEGRYVKLDSVRIINSPQTVFNIGGGGTNFTIVTVQSDTFTMRVDRDYELAFNGNPVPSGLFNVTGVGSQFDGSAPHNSGYQIFPSRYTDLEILSVTGDAIAFANTTASVLENAGTYQVMVTIADTLSSPATIDVVNTTNGTAVLGVDFNFNDTTLTFNPNTIDTFLLDITIIDNAVVNPDKTVELALRNVSGAVFGLDTNFVLTIINDDIPTYTIGVIRGNDNLGGSVNVGLADSLGVTCRVFALVTTPDIGGSNRSVTLQDATGAISIFQPGSTNPPVLNVGDSVEIVGTIGSFNGLSQFVNSTTINVISSGNALPAPLTVDSLGEFTESALIRMENMRFVDPALWTASAGGGSFNISITNNIDTFTLRVDGDLPLVNQLTPPAAPFNVVGFGGQFDNSDPYTSGYQIFAIDSANFTPYIAPIPTYTIGQVTTLDANFVVDSLNVDCKLEGIVYGENFRAGANGLEFTLIDETTTTDGISVFSASSNLGYTVTEGDKIRVIGSVSQVLGLARIIADSIVVINQGNALKAADLVTSLDEFSESNLVKIENLQYIPGNWTGTGSSFDVLFANATDTFTIKIDNDCDLYAASEPTAGFTYEVTGIGGQVDVLSPFDEGYVLLPRSSSDIVFTTAINSFADNKIRVYPNPTSDAVNIIFEDNSKRTVVVMDILGNEKQRITTDSREVNLNLSDLSNGQYFLRINTTTGQTVQKIILSK